MSKFPLALQAHQIPKKHVKIFAQSCFLLLMATAMFQLATGQESNPQNELQAQELALRTELQKLWELPAEIPAKIEAQVPTQADFEQAIVDRREAQQAAAESEDIPTPPKPIGIGEFLAIGQASLDVIFFSYTRQEDDGFVDGQTKGIFAAQEVLRADEYRLDMKELEAELFGKSNNAPTTWVSIKTGSWYLPLNLLLSQSRTEIRRSNMRIIGEGCRYSGDDELIEIYGKTYSEFYRTPAKSSPDPLDPQSTISPSTTSASTQP